MDILRAEAASRSANQTNHTVWYCDEQAETCATFAVVWSALAGVLVLALALQLLAVSSRERAVREPHSSTRLRAVQVAASDELATDAQAAEDPAAATNRTMRTPFLPPERPPTLGDWAHSVSGGGHASGAPSELRLSWERLSYRVNGQDVLQPSSGTVAGGLWIMIGPSGAGKSSLLGVLAGRKAHGAIAGSVRLNGTKSSARARRELLGYVTQDDVLPGTSTVREHLHFHAQLRLPWLARKERAHLVERALSTVSLTAKAEHIIGDAYVRGLSGGERRRVSVATELLALAAGGCGLVLMDEPLSGLDSANASLLTKALLELTSRSPSAHTNPLHQRPTPASGGAANRTASLPSTDDTPGSTMTTSPLAASSAANSTRADGRAEARTGAPARGNGDTSLDGAPLELVLPETPTAEPGPTILLTVHQPSHRLLESVSGCIVMGQRGHLLYCGPRRSADGRCMLSSHFDGDGVRLSSYSGNPAEALLEAMGDESPHVARRMEWIGERERERSLIALDGIEHVTHATADSNTMSLGGLLVNTHRGSTALWHTSSSRGVSMLARPLRASRGASVLIKLRALCIRQMRLAVRHPLLLWLNLGLTALFSSVCAVVFYQLNFDFDTGVLTRVGLVLFLGLYFMLSALAPVPLWQQERLLYFQERAAGCYGPFTYVLSRTLYDGLLQRMLPSLLCAAIVYPTVGLSHSDPASPWHAALFCIALCLSNLLGTAVITCFGILCASSSVATILSVLFILFTVLFCGFVVNIPTLQARGTAALGAWQPHHFSFLYYFNELLLYDEIKGKTIDLKWQPDQAQPVQRYPVHGEEVLLHFGFALNCSHLFDDTDLPCLHDLYLPTAGLAFFVCAAILLLGFCVKDPH